MATQISARWIQSLLKFVPGARRIALLGLANNVAMQINLCSMQAAARTKGAEVHLLDAGSSGAVERTFKVMLEGRFDGFVVAAASQIPVQRSRIVEFAARHRLPAVCARESYVDAGGLLSIGHDANQRYVRAPEYVHWILQGAKPADLPVEQPTKCPVARFP